MEYRILGPLEVCDGERSLALGGRKQRTLLAVLSLHPGEAVSSERLIDALWGDQPPATAAKSIQVYVSHLRKALGAGALATRPGGYALEIAAGDLDAGRFEELAADGRRRLAAGDPKGSADALRRALALWRGPALQDFAYDTFAANDIARLEELRLAALEDRVDADLALGRHSELVAELQALVREHPLRERVRGQLMLALYRCGRQAEALEAYQHGRRAMVDELGLEPGEDVRELEQAILRHDPALGRSGRETPTLLRRLPRGRWLAVGGAVLLAAAVVAAFVVGSGGATHAAALLAPDTVGEIDPATGELVGGLPLAGRPDRVAAADGRLWTVADDARAIAGVDLRTRSLKAVFPAGGSPRAVAAGFGSVWALDERAGVLMRIDPDYGHLIRRWHIAKPLPVALTVATRSFDAWSVAVGSGAVWVTDGSDRLTRVDPRTGARDRFHLGLPLDGVTTVDDEVWAISGHDATVLRVDPRRPRKHTQIRIASANRAASPYPIAIGAGPQSIWVLNANTATVTQIDRHELAITRTFPLGVEHVPLRLAVGAGAVWVATADGELFRIDPAKPAVTSRTVAHGLNDVVVAGDRVWVTATRGPGGFGTVQARAGKAHASAPGVHPLGTETCSPLYYRPGDRPRVLVASDLPLQGPGELGAQVGEAVRFELARAGFRAGHIAIAYQACDDSTPTPDLTFVAKCPPNARLYAHDSSLVAVIGPFATECTKLEVPILNRAPGGPLANLSPASSYVGLTRSDAGALPDEPARYAPTGRRSFVRVIPDDNAQAAAGAVLAQRLGVRRVYVLEDGIPYGLGLAADFRRAAHRIGLDVVGTEQMSGSRRLAQHVAASRADGVFLAGNDVPYGADIVRALRRRLPHARLLATDGFSDPAFPRRAGQAAEGVLVSSPGRAVGRLPDRGAAFARRFGAAIGEPASIYSVYAAQAVDLLLEALAHSDGSRASVRRALFAAKVADGLVGSFAITAEGDTTAHDVTVFRVTHTAFRVAEVVTPPPALVSP